MRRARRGALVALLALLVLSIAASAGAQAGSAIEGHVVSIDERDIVLDLATKKGAAEDDVVEIWRPIRIKHPVTGRMIADRFPIGSLKLTVVRNELSLARPVGKLTRPVQVGDIVVLRKAEPEPAVEAAPAAEPGAPEAAPKASATVGQAPLLTAQDPDAAAVTQLIESLRGTDLVTRITRYEEYVRANPRSRFSPVLYESAAELRRLLDLESEAMGRAQPRMLSFEPPEAALAGFPLTLAIEVAGPASGAVLHARRQGEVAYVTTPMRATGRGYYSATLPGDRMRASRLQYFIEAIDAGGKAVSVVGSSASPEAIEVDAIPAPTPPTRHDAVVSVSTDYADWNRLRGNDYAWQTEGYFGMRFDDVGLRAGRTGFGVYRGVGGSLEELDQLGFSGRRVGLTYGYLEGEFGFTPLSSLIARGVIGLRQHGVASGAQLHVRIGNDRRTNLTIGGEVLGGVGLRLITQLELATFQKFPVLLRTEVSNQPAGAAASDTEIDPADAGTPIERTSRERGELGARAIAQVGYRLMPDLVLAVRGSYQGRTINHAGPGFGGAVTYTW